MRVRNLEGERERDVLVGVDELPVPPIRGRRRRFLIRNAPPLTAPALDDGYEDDVSMPGERSTVTDAESRGRACFPSSPPGDAAPDRGHDAAALQTMAPVGKPFGIECRQNLFPVARVAVEPVSAYIQADDDDDDEDVDDHGFFGPAATLPRKFLQPAEEEDDDEDEKRGSSPSFVKMNPAAAPPADRTLCDGRSCVVRYTRFHSFDSRPTKKGEEDEDEDECP